MAEARKDKRTLLSLKIRYKSATLEDFIERYSSDISRGGVFIKAKKPLAVGTLLKFEFMLQDQSTLIHGVGRVVWRREEADASAQDPAGMGIKFIKMDAESRAVVERIADDRLQPGVFDQGKAGRQSLQPDDADELEIEDQTKVRHVSEFLASALEEGGAGEPARREAHAGRERARRQSESNHSAAAYGAFAAPQDLPAQQKQSVSEAQARGAMSAFGGAGAGSAARISSSAAPAFDELDPEEDFLENETTKVHDYPTDSYRPEAAATVIAKDAAALLYSEQQATHSEKRATPVVPADRTPGNSLEAGVPDLFGTADVDSFGPAPGEMIDPGYFDSDPGQGGAPVPEAPGIPSEAFKVPQAPEPVWTTRPTPEKQARPGLVILLVGVLALGGGAVAAWQFGLADDLIESISPLLTGSTEPTRVVEPVAAPVAVEPEGASAEAPVQETAGSDEASATKTQGNENAGPAAETAPVKAAAAEAVDTGIMKFEVVSQPPGAFVSVNGKRAGRTPVAIEYEVGTKLSIYTKIRGFLGQRQRIEVASGQEPVTFKLVPLPYVVQVVTSPPGAMASAVGGGVVVTPGELEFRSMPRSRKIVFSMNGYETASTFVKRASFTEETSRMFATVTLSLQKAGDTPNEQSAEPPAAAAPSEPEPEPPAEAAPSEETAEAESPAESPAEPKAVEEPAAPSETEASDAP